jgi:hypothetical protein
MQVFAALSHERPLTEGPVAALVAAADAIAREVPGLRGARAAAWWSPTRRTAVVRLGHPPERCGGLSRHWEDGPRLQVLDGFPLDRRGGIGHDGPVDVDGADGRYALLDVAHDDVAVTCDRIGAYAVYARELSDGTLAVGNSPALLARIPPHARLDDAAVEDVLVASWVFGDRTVWDGVRRLPPGTSTAAHGRLRPSSASRADPAHAAATLPVHRDVEAGADLLRDALRATGAGARGTVELGLSGGRDSRVILAAATAAGLRPHLFTIALQEDPAFPETGDVVAARRIARELDLDHEVRVVSTHVDDSERWMRAVTGGVSAVDATPSSVGEIGRTPIVLTGAAVELGWLTHGIALTQVPPEQAIPGSVGAWIHTFPGHMGSAGAYERTLERGCAGPRAWHAEGLPGPLLAEAFFAFERTAGWAAPTHFAYEPFFDTVSPGWSADLLPILWSLDPRDREMDRWRRGMIHALCPEIECLPFSGGAPVWPDQTRESSYMLAGERRDKVRRFVRSRVLGSGVGRVPAQVAALRRMQADVRTAIREDDDLRRLVDVRRAGRLAGASVTRLDPRSLQRLVRLAHVVRLLRDARGGGPGAVDLRPADRVLGASTG